MRKMGRCFKMRKMWEIQNLQILERRDKAKRTGQSERNRDLRMLRRGDSRGSAGVSGV